MTDEKRLEDSEPVWQGQVTTDMFNLNPPVRWDTSGDDRFPDTEVTFARVEITWIRGGDGPDEARVAAYRRAVGVGPWRSESNPALLDLFEPLIEACRPKRTR